MPYKIPESRNIETPTLDRSISTYIPLSDRAWYRSSQKAASLIDPGLMASSRRDYQRHQRHTKQLLLTATDSLIPPRRIKDNLNGSADKFRTVKTILTGELCPRNVKKVSHLIDDDVLLMPVEKYLQEVNAREILREERVERECLRTKKFKTGDELRLELFGSDTIELIDVEKPRKPVPTGTAYDELKQRHEKLLPPRMSDVTRTKLTQLDLETDELMRPIRFEMRK